MTLLINPQAKSLYLRDVHYIVRGGEIDIVDEHTGRVMPRRRWQVGAALSPFFCPPFLVVPTPTDMSTASVRRCLLRLFSVPISRILRPLFFS